MATPLLKTSYLVSVAVFDPRSVYFGDVQAVTTIGLRLTRIDWPTGRCTGADVLIPWSKVAMAYVATPAHDACLFLDDALSLSKQWTASSATQTRQESATSQPLAGSAPSIVVNRVEPASKTPETDGE